MILHIRLKPDGNGDVFTGTPDEVKKQFDAWKRKVDRSGVSPNFHHTYEIIVFQAGSNYGMINDAHSQTWDIYQKKPRGVCLGKYRTFGTCLNRLLKLIANEQRVER